MEDAKPSVAGELRFRLNGHGIVVRKNDGHPENYLWIYIDDRRFFLGVLKPGMRRRDVKERTREWLHEHPQHWLARGDYNCGGSDVASISR